MIYKIFAFIVFLSPLIFFHELGHFLLARLFGVRVETFSLGFGKRIFAFKRGDTDYRISLIPLGGYVKMYGENLLNKDEIPADQREFAYNHKSKWARFCIIFAGPLANFILAFVLYFFLIVKGEEVREFKVAKLTQDSKMYQAGFRTGDIIKKINGEFFYTQEDMVFLDEQENRFEVERAGGNVFLDVNEKPESLLEDYVYKSSYLVEPIFYNASGEKIILSDTDKVEDALKYSFQELIDSKASDFYLIKEKDGSLLKIFNRPSGISILEKLRKDGFYRSDLHISKVISNTPAAKAGVKDDTLITHINGKEVYSFDDLRSSLVEGKGSAIELNLIDFKGNSYTKKITPKENSFKDEKYYSIGVQSGLFVHRGKKITIEGQGFVVSLKSAYKRTHIAFMKTFRVIRDMFIGSADVWSNLGGPIAIANVASSSLQISFEFFLRFMAIMSINLGLMNLLPIPVLDGGHILFIFFELLNGGTLSQKKMEFAQKIGLSFLLLLMGFVIFNDISRFVFQ